MTIVVKCRRAIAAAAGLLVAARSAGSFRRVTVEGPSMEPALTPGDRLVVVPVRRLRRGAIVAVYDPRDPRRLLVKRVASVDPENRLLRVEGDNTAESTDSRAFGPVARSAVVGRVVYRYAPLARAGPVGGDRGAVPSPEMATAALDALLEPAYLHALPTLPIDEIRNRRDQATEVEVGLSYVRRLIQGRLDIVLAEVRQRETGGSGGDIADLVQRLPQILGDRVRAPGTGRLPTLMAPAEPELAEVRRLDAIVDAESLASLPALDDAQLRAIVEALANLEHEVSAGRRSVHDVIDQLQDELVRRYKSGEANVDTLLS